ncbi:MAG: segregation/condensation protein A [Rubrobacteridae bacterium]|nr:segregation/condensation protein A [Rubrobacteridae bacterium]
MSYELKLDVYEGPIDLLANLVSRQKLDIYEIPIANIIDGYLEHITQLDESDLEISSEFVVIAATLLDIKAASLLPGEIEDIEDEEPVNPQEARELLIARLIEYKKSKNVTLELAARYEAENKYYIRDAGIEDEFIDLVPDFLAGISLTKLTKMFIAVNDKKEISLILADHITPKPLSVDEYVIKVKEQLKGAKVKSFREVTLECGSKVEIITAFLAVLELYKRGLVELGQAETFGEITIFVSDEAAAGLADFNTDKEAEKAGVVL